MSSPQRRDQREERTGNTQGNRREPDVFPAPPPTPRSPLLPFSHPMLERPLRAEARAALDARLGPGARQGGATDPQRARPQRSGRRVAAAPPRTRHVLGAPGSPRVPRRPGHRETNVSEPGHSSRGARGPLLLSTENGVGPRRPPSGVRATAVTRMSVAISCPPHPPAPSSRSGASSRVSG